MSIDERFSNARDSVVLGDTLIEGIGCLSEKTTHAVLKLYLEPDTSFHEQKVVGRMVADIRNEAGIFEVQTASFGRMKKKLEAFLEIDKVTIVYPCTNVKWIVWVDENGECVKRNKSTKKGSVLDVFYELYQIREFLLHKSLRIMVFMLDFDEYKSLEIKGRGRRRGHKRFDRIPLELRDIYILKEPSDYLALLPPLEGEFTAAELARSIRMDRTRAYGIVSVLTALGVVAEVDKKGRSRIYRVIDGAEGKKEAIEE